MEEDEAVEGVDNGEDRVTDPDYVEDDSQPEDSPMEDEETSDDDPIDIAYNKKYNYEYGYNPPGYKPTMENIGLAKNEEDLDETRSYSPTLIEEDSEEEHSNNEDLKEGKKALTSKEMVCRKNDITNRINDKYLTRYNDDGVNQTATYESVLNKPGVQGEAKLMLHKTKNSQGYHFEANTRYNDGYQPEDRKYIKAKRLTNRKERLPEITMGALIVEKFDDKDGYETGDNNYNLLSNSNTIATKDNDFETANMMVKIENNEEQTNQTYRYDNNQLIPAGSTSANTNAVGNSNRQRESLRHTSENNVNAVEEILNLKRKNGYKQDTMTILTDSSWSIANATCGGSLSLDRSAAFNDKSLSETVSMQSGTDSQYTNPIEVEPRIKEEIIEEEPMSIDTSYTSIQEETFQEHQPETWSEYRIVIAPTSIEDKRGEDTSEKPGSSTNEDISNLPALSEDEVAEPIPETQTKSSCKNKKKNKIKIRLQKKEIHKAKRRKKRILETLITSEYYKIKTKLHKHQIYYLKDYTRWLKIKLSQTNSKLSNRVTTSDRNNEETLSDTSLEIQKGSSTITNSHNQRQRGAERQASQSRDQYVGDQTTSATQRVASVRFQPSCAIQVKKRDTDKTKAVTMEAKIESLLKEYRDKSQRRDKLRRYQLRVAHLQQLISEIPDGEDIPTEREQQLEEEIKQIEKIHNQRDEARRAFNITDKVLTIDGAMGASFDASVSVVTNLEKINLNDNAMLILMLLKEHDIRTKIRMMGDIEIDALYDLKVEMPMVAKINKTTPMAQDVATQRREEILTPMPGVTLLMEPMDVAAEEEIYTPLEKDAVSSITNTPEEVSEAETIQPTPGTSKEGGRTLKRRKSYKEPSTSESES